VRNFLAVLISRERLAALTEIVEEYRLEMNRRLQISDAEVLTARPLQEQERAKLEREVAELAGTRVNATFLEDKSLIGGAIVRIGSTIYDGSVRGRLERLRERLVSS
jgi:F-type H+-transporting ATPase subunit delta